MGRLRRYLVLLTAIGAGVNLSLTATDGDFVALAAAALAGACVHVLLTDLWQDLEASVSPQTRAARRLARDVEQAVARRRAAQEQADAHASGATGGVRA
jgi:hypothetical protein